MYLAIMYPEREGKVVTQERVRGTTCEGEGVGDARVSDEKDEQAVGDDGEGCDGVENRIPTSYVLRARGLGAATELKQLPTVHSDLDQVVGEGEEGLDPALDCGAAGIGVRGGRQEDEQHFPLVAVEEGEEHDDLPRV